MVRQDPTNADRYPTVAACWIGESRSRIELGDKATSLGGDDAFNPMQMLQATLAACDVAGSHLPLGRAPVGLAFFSSKLAHLTMFKRVFFASILFDFGHIGQSSDLS